VQTIREMASHTLSVEADAWKKAGDIAHRLQLGMNNVEAIQSSRSMSIRILRWPVCRFLVGPIIQPVDRLSIPSLLRHAVVFAASHHFDHHAESSVAAQRVRLSTATFGSAIDDGDIFKDGVPLLSPGASAAECC
jgi:hypothetical protein